MNLLPPTSTLLDHCSLIRKRTVAAKLLADGIDAVTNGVMSYLRPLEEVIE